MLYNTTELTEGTFCETEISKDTFERYVVWDPLRMLSHPSVLLFVRICAHEYHDLQALN